MTQTQNPALVFKSELLQNTADMIKAAGMRVFISKWSHNETKPTYFHFTDGENIGYCQEGHFGGISFSTVHRPCKECGTGYGLTDFNDPGIYEPTIKDAKQAFINAPSWARPTERAAVIKYKNWEEYTQRNTMPEYLEY